jgi:hypothetical protein
MAAKLHDMEDEAQMRRALEEIERLLRESAQSGVRLDPWVEQLAEELRAVVPASDAEDALLIARRIAADPHSSVAAQSRVRVETVKTLKG